MEWSDRIGRRLKLRDLHILLAVVQHGSISKAADHLAISHPVVSKAIAELEHTLGVRLLDRSPKGIEPTMYGRVFLDSSRAAFDDLRQGVQSIEFLSDPATGELRIGSTEPMAAGLTSAIVNSLSTQYPRVVFHVVEADAANLQRELNERNVELVIGRFPPLLREDDVDVEMLLGERQYVVAGIANPLVRRGKITLGELLDQAWILPPHGSMAGSQIQEAFRATGLEVPRARVVTFSIALRISLLATGRFLTVLPGSMLEHSPMRSSFTVLPVELSANPRPAGIVTLKGRMLSPLAKLFTECARTMDSPTAKGATTSVRVS
jgi:DNA-binding transcriptional LysR family regulator